MISKFKILIVISTFGLTSILTSYGSSTSNITRCETIASIAEPKTPRKCRIFNEVKQVKTMLSGAACFCYNYNKIPVFLLFEFD